MSLRIWVAAGSVVLILVLGPFFGYWRAAVAVGMFVAILWLGLSYFHAVRPVDPDQVEDVRTRELKYVCTMCGLELKVEWDAVDKPPPRHCREPMQLFGDEGGPPLRPVRGPDERR